MTYLSRRVNCCLYDLADAESIQFYCAALNALDAEIKSIDSDYIDVGVDLSNLKYWGENPLMSYSDGAWHNPTDYTIVKSWHEKNDLVLTRVNPADSRPWKIEPAANYRC